MDKKQRHFVGQRASVFWKNYPNDFQRLTQRGAKDHVNLLVRNFKKKYSSEKKASGISPVDTELDQLCEEICERMEMYTAELEKEKENKKREEVAAKDVRLKAMEALSQTKKRSGESEEKDKPAKKRNRSNGSEMLSYLRERAEE